MSRNAHSVYDDRGRGRQRENETEGETECLTGDVGRKRGGAAVGGGGRRGCWWWVVKREINQVKAICGNGCCSVIRNPVTQQLL